MDSEKPWSLRNGCDESGEANSGIAYQFNSLFIAKIVYYT